MEDGLWRVTERVGGPISTRCWSRPCSRVRRACSRGLPVALMLAITIIAGSSCRPADREGGGQQDEIVVGALVPLTGPGSEMGPATRDGFVLFWEMNGAEFGWPVRTLVEDNKGNPRDGLTAFYALQARAGGRLTLVLTQLSGVAAAVAPATTSVGFLQFGLAATPALLEHPWNYRTYASAERIGATLALVPGTVRGVETVYLLTMADEYARAVSDAFRSATTGGGVEILGEELFPADITDINSVVQKALAASPDGIVVTGFGRAPVSAIRRLRELGFTGVIIGDPAAAYRPYTALIGDAAEGLYVVDLDFPSTSPNASAIRFREGVVERYQREPDLGNVLAYASMEVFQEVARRAGSVTPEALAQVLGDTLTVETALGQARLIEKDTQFPLVLKVVRNGRAELLR